MSHPDKNALRETVGNGKSSITAPCFLAVLSSLVMTRGNLEHRRIEPPLAKTGPRSTRRPAMLNKGVLKVTRRF